MELFDLSRLIHYRNKAAAHFKDYNFLKVELSNILLENLDYLKGDYPLALDLGSHTGEVYNILQHHPKIHRIINLDFSKNMLLHDPSKTIKILANFPNLPFINNSFNLVTSVFSLHSVNNIIDIFKEIYRVLISNGVLMLCLPCYGNLSALNNAFLETELTLNTSISNRIHPFLDIKALGDLINKCGFTNIIANKETVTIMYKSLINILKDFRGMGEKNVLLNKKKTVLSKKYWNTFSTFMEKQKDPQTLAYPVKIEVCNLLAWKP